MLLRRRALAHQERDAALVGRVEVGEEDDHDVAGQAVEDVPDSVQKRNAEMAPNVAKHLKKKVIKRWYCKLLKVMS